MITTPAAILQLSPIEINFLDAIYTPLRFTLFPMMILAFISLIKILVG